MNHPRNFAVGLLTIVLLKTLAATAQGHFPSNIPFDQPTLSDVVARVKRLGVKRGQTVYLRMDRLGAPESLHTRNPDTYMRGQEAGNVWASRAASGELTVIVTTADYGHAGSLGYGYSETPPRASNGQLSLAEDAEHSLSCTDAQHKVAEKWWEVWSCEMD